MKKSSSIILAIIVVIVVVAGGFALFHKPNKTTPTSTANKSSQSDNTPTVNNAVLTTKTDATLGKYMADPNGKALYTYDSDTSGVSNCSGSCLTNWPAYQDTGSTQNLPAGVGTIKRSDNGQIQYTYNGMPLYYFVGDSNGSATGNGVENFSLAKPAAATTSSSSSDTTTTTPAPTSSTNPSSSYPY